MTLRQYRQSAGLTQQQLADAAGVNIRMIQKYESQTCDIGNMTLRVAISIADALSIDVKDLLNHEH